MGGFCAFLQVQESGQVMDGDGRGISGKDRPGSFIGRELFSRYSGASVELVLLLSISPQSSRFNFLCLINHSVKLSKLSGLCIVFVRPMVSLITEPQPLNVCGYLATLVPVAEALKGENG
ncbi:hypothetical protein PoB_004065800 [Plakobranchus ocellatus]|uniref:Uncharacterized protein n=1 Tax=Plakobranchus ocellatus TaxID=259542 RepID=A0AAV4B3J8_9GAST|nr:hypothetical protein PoB_004065800 [Plakobranchus ocellatus]